MSDEAEEVSGVPAIGNRVNDKAQIDLFRELTERQHEIDRSRIEVEREQLSQDERNRKTFEEDSRRQHEVTIRAIQEDARGRDLFYENEEKRRKFLIKMYFGSLLVFAVFLGGLIYAGMGEAAIQVLAGGILVGMTFFAGRGSTLRRTPPSSEE